MSKSKFNPNEPIYHVFYMYFWREESDGVCIGDGATSNSLFKALKKAYAEISSIPTWDYNDEYELIIILISQVITLILIRNGLSTFDQIQPQLPARTDRVLHGTMVSGGEHEADAHLAHTVRDLRRGKIEAHPGRFQNVGAAGLARHRAVAVLRDMAARRAKVLRSEAPRYRPCSPGR